MHCYMERYLDEAILNGAPVRFERVLDMSISQSSTGDYADFEMTPEGYIDFKTPGYYLLKWTTASMTGFSQDGSWFELRQFNFDTSQWQPAGNGVDVGQLAPGGVKKDWGESGYIAFEVAALDLAPAPAPPEGEEEPELGPTEEVGFGLAEEMEEGPVLAAPFRIALFNVSGHSVSLSRFPALKASLAIHGVEYFDGIIKYLLELLDQYEEECCAFDLEAQIAQLELIEQRQNERLTQLENFKLCFQDQLDWYYLPDYGSGQSATGIYNCPNFTGLTIQTIRTGYIHTFILSGSCTNISSGRYFLTVSQYPPLANYSVESGTAMLVPVFTVQQGANGPCDTLVGWLDGTGIYLSSGAATTTNRVWGFSVCVVLTSGAATACQLELPNPQGG